MTAADPVIDTHGLAKRYGRTDALVDLTLRLELGEIFAFLGPNGAGKTTAVTSMAGRPSAPAPAAAPPPMPAAPGRSMAPSPGVGLAARAGDL